MLNCDFRTSVDVTIHPGGSMGPVTTRLSQQNEQDAELLVYSGPIIPSNDDFTVPVTLALSSSPTGSGSDGQYIIIADRVSFKLTSTDITGSGNSTGAGNGTGSARRGWGVYEWPLHDSPSNINATGVIPNDTETALTTLAFDLFSGLGNSTSAASQSAIHAIVPYTEDITFVAGRFSLSGDIGNIAQFNDGALSSLANQGLGGTVSSMLLYGDTLFVGGSFNATGDGTTTLRNIAAYNVPGNEWAALGGGVDGPVTSLGISNGHLAITGNFTHTLITSTTAIGSPGLASWDISGGQWINSGGLLVGSMTTVVNATSSDDSTQYIAGTVSMYLKYGADGAASLSNDQDGQVAITPFGARLDGSEISTSSTPAKRSDWVLNLRGLLAPRQSGPSALPDEDAPAPSVLSGVFWTNTTSSHQVMIIGGNFTVPGTTATSLAIYDPADTSINGVQGNQIDGVVRSLLVVGSKLYVGGEFTLEGVTGESFAVYDLSDQSWDTDVSGLTGGCSG